MSENVTHRLFIVGLIVAILASSIISVVTTHLIISNTTIASWHQAVKFSGDSIDGYAYETTDAFYVPGDLWRIHVDVIAANPDEIAFNPVEFHFYVFKKDVGIVAFKNLEHSIFRWEIPSYSGTEYITGSGNFLMIVESERVLWNLTVEAYH